MDSRGGSQNRESVIPFTLEKPRHDNAESDTIYVYRRKVRPTGPRLLHLFPLTPADEPSKKKRFFGQARVPLSEHDPANVPGNCDSVIPFRLAKAFHDCRGDTNRLRERPLLRCMFPLTPGGEPSLTKSFFSKEGLQMSEADPGTRPAQNVVNRSENELGSPYKDLCPLSLSPYPAQRSLLEDTPENPLRKPEVELPFLSSEVQSETFIDSCQSSSAQFVDPSDMSPRVTDQPLEVPGEVVPFRPEPTNLATNLSNGGEVVPFEPEPTNLWNGRDAVAPFKPESTTSTNGASNGSGFPSSSRALVQNGPHLTRRWGASRQRTVIGAQSVGVVSNNNRRLLPRPPAQQTQPQAQSPSQSRPQPPAQPPAQPRAQPRVQPTAKPAAKPGVQHGPRSKSSPFKGVTHYKRTGRWEAHIWKNKDDKRKGRQIYLGASSTPNQAARAYDRAVINFRGVNAEINFLLSDYQSELPQLQAITFDQLVTILRKQSAGKGTPHPKYPSP